MNSTLRNFFQNIFPTSKYIIYPDDSFKKKWDLLIVVCLLYMSIILPFRIAFEESDDEEWGPYDIVELIMNIIFFLDIVLNFFTAYYDENENLELDKKKIAKNYITSWFIIDVISTIPLQNIFVSLSNYNNVLRISRIPKIIRFIKMTR